MKCRLVKLTFILCCLVIVGFKLQISIWTTKKYIANQNAKSRTSKYPSNYVPKLRGSEWGGVGAPLNLQGRWPKSIEHRREGKKPYVQKDLERTRCAVHWSPRKPEMRLNSCDTCESYGPACLNISPLASIRLLLCFYSYILVQNWLNSVLKENSNFGCLKLCTVKSRAVDRSTI